MNLGEIRTLFAKSSGRTDLVNPDYTDNGANFHINAGIRLLDALQDSPKSMALHIANVTVNTHKLAIPNCRAIYEVWCADATGRTRLEPVDLDNLREYYGDATTEQTVGKPLYYSPAVIGLSPAQSAFTSADMSALFDYYEVMLGDHFAYNSIVFMPVADATYTLRVQGNFYSKTLALDTDYNFWTVGYPELVIQAAYYSIEVILYRNLSGSRSLLEAIKVVLRGIDNDLVERDIATINRMEG